MSSAKKNTKTQNTPEKSFKSDSGKKSGSFKKDKRHRKPRDDEDGSSGADIGF